MIFLLVNFACLKIQEIIIFHCNPQVYALILLNLIVGGLSPSSTRSYAVAITGKKNPHQTLAPPCGPGLFAQFAIDFFPLASRGCYQIQRVSVNEIKSSKFMSFLKYQNYRIYNKISVTVGIKQICVFIL